MKNRIFRVVISAIITIVLMSLLCAVTPQENPSRILVLLGGTMPEGIIQGFTYFLFIFGILELFNVNNTITHEEDAFSANLLPEQENWVLDGNYSAKAKVIKSRLV